MKKIQFANNCSKNNGKGELNEWFDEECREVKSIVNKKRKVFQTGLFSINITSMDY